MINVLNVRPYLTHVVKNDRLYKNKYRGACVQAERKLSTSTLIPDLDNASVGNCV